MEEGFLGHILISGKDTKMFLDGRGNKKWERFRRRSLGSFCVDVNGTTDGCLDGWTWLAEVAKGRKLKQNGEEEMP